MSPKILIFHTLQWANAARLALAFGERDCSVHLLCLRRHPARTLSGLAGIYAYNPFAPLYSLLAAIDASQPDLIVPCDDPALAHLLRLYRRLEVTAPAERRIRSLIERSLGDPAACQWVATRSCLPAIAARAKVLVPRTEIVSTLDDAVEWLRREGFPAVLKADCSWGGNGVVVAGTLMEARRTFRRMSDFRDLARTIKWAVSDRDPYLLSEKLRGARRALSLQAFISGKPASCAVACWEGEVLACIAVEVVATRSRTGNATVVRLIDNRDILETASRVVRQLGTSGLCGFDFVIEDGSSRPYLIEINPRATQIDHLALGPRRDLPAALRSRVANEQLRESPRVTDLDTVALFPHELRRDPDSQFLRTAYHDVPSQAPELVQAYRLQPN